MTETLVQTLVITLTSLCLFVALGSTIVLTLIELIFWIKTVARKINIFWR